MEEQDKVIEQAVEEIQNSSEEELRKIIEQWFERIRTQSLKIGAQMISAAVAGVIEKHLKKTTKPSHRDYQRCIDEIIKIVSVQLKQNTEQNDSEADTVKEDNINEEILNG